MAVARTPRGVEAPGAEAFDGCKVFPGQHAWDQYHPSGWQPPAPGCFRMDLRCTRCGTERHDVYSIRFGILVGRNYDWPDGYLMVKGEERPSKSEMRVDMFTRLRADLERYNAVGLAEVAPLPSKRKVS